MKDAKGHSTPMGIDINRYEDAEIVDVPYRQREQLDL